MSSGFTSDEGVDTKMDVVGVEKIESAVMRGPWTVLNAVRAEPNLRAAVSPPSPVAVMSARSRN
jgi:hypothetical protein